MMAVKDDVSCHTRRLRTVVVPFLIVIKPLFFKENFVKEPGHFFQYLFFYQSFGIYSFSIQSGCYCYCTHSHILSVAFSIHSSVSLLIWVHPKCRATHYNMWLLLDNFRTTVKLLMALFYLLPSRNVTKYT